MHTVCDLCVRRSHAHSYCVCIRMCIYMYIYACSTSSGETKKSSFILALFSSEIEWVHAGHYRMEHITFEREHTRVVLVYTHTKHMQYAITCAYLGCR